MNDDMTIVCQDCGQEFVWTRGEQEFYREKGLEQPKLCMICRAKWKARGEDPGAEAKAVEPKARGSERD